MIPYDESLTFRALQRPKPIKPKPTSPARARPLRDEALDDLHRTLYGSLHPAAERYALEDQPPSTEDSQESPSESWLEDNAALAAALAVMGALALVKFLGKPKSPPLAFSETPPTPPPSISQTQPSPASVPTAPRTETHP